MTKLLFPILFYTLLTSSFTKRTEHPKKITTCSELTDFTEDTTDYVLDSAYLTEGVFPFALEDLKLGNRVILQKMDKNDIINHRIKSIRLKRQYTEKFDERGNKIFEKWDAWSAGSNFSYEFDNKRKPTSISILDIGGRTIGKAKYKYDGQGKLLQAGGLLFKYYQNGLLISIENSSEIERYEYDTNRRMVHINFDWKPGVIGCGNRITEWKGEYDERGQLITEETVGFPDNLIKHHQYNKEGRLIRTKITGGFESTIKYFYVNGLLAITKTYNYNGKLINTEQYIYERY